MYKCNLQQYFPNNAVNNLHKADGSPHARYTLTKNRAGFDGLYNSLLKLPKAGDYYVWQKEYFKNGVWETATYGILFMGADGSVSEVGDWLHLGGGNFGAFGYRKSDGSNTGLVWSPAGGLSGTPQFDEMATISQAFSGAAFAQNGSRCYSECGLIDVIPSMAVNGVIYTDVAHIVMYHGVSIPGRTPLKATTMPLVANGVYYRNRADWDEYAMELWLVKGVGVVKERTPFIENASWWGLPNFIGELFSETSESWTTSIVTAAIK